MMRQKILSGIGLLLILAVGFGLSGIGSQTVQAESVQYLTDEQAFLAVLGDYMTAAGETADWQLGEIERLGMFAVTIAQAGETASDYQDFVLLMARGEENGEWSAVAPKVVENKTYNQWLADMPEELVNGFEKSYYFLYDELEPSRYTPRAIPLHHFPWAINRQAILTQKDGSYHTHQLDFVMRTIDDIYASKPGLVIFVKESSGVGGCDIDLWQWANMVVVQHSATEFSWYVHLKQNSATVNVGDLIGYGTKIGEQGNTGFACGTTGIHLHYMTSNQIPSSWPNPSIPNYAPWPPSGSIYPTDFIESTYASLVQGNTYVSQNAYPPGACSDTPSQVNLYDNTYCNSNLRSSNITGLLNLVDLGVDARLESIEIPTGWSVGLYLNQNELGAKTCISGSDSMLWDNLFSNGERVANNVLWARLYDQAGCPYPNEQGITLYPEPNFVGTPLWGVVGEITSNEPGYVVGSVYIPNGYSALIYDQDNKAGNSVCLSRSVLDLSQVSGWPGGAVESVSLVLGNICVPEPTLVEPEHNGIAFSEKPEVCWKVDQGYFSYNVNIFAGNQFSEYSGWIKDTCWISPELVGKTGIFYWRVQAKDKYGDIGLWSETHKFTLVEDTIPPTAKFTNLEDGKDVFKPRANMVVSAQDVESDVARVHFFAWYDDGSGYDWHYQGVDEDGTDGWKAVWNLVPVISEDAAAWASAEDLGGNSTSVYVSGLRVRDSSSSDGGDDYRGQPGNGGTEDPPQDPVDSPPEIPSELPLEPREEPIEEPVEEPVEVVVLPKPPAVLSPVFNEEFYQPEQVELCWETNQADAMERYRVEIFGARELISPWISQGCWNPAGLEAGSGDYTWHVQAKVDEVGESDWSANGAFRLVADKIEPVVKFLTPVEGEVFLDKVMIQLEAADGESGILLVQVLAWYDAAWHQIYAELPSTEGFEVSWDVSGIPAQKSQLWVYVVDKAGNLGSAMIPSLQLGAGSSDLPEAQKYHKSLEDGVLKNRGD